MPTLTIDDKDHKVKRIGSGAFSRIYKSNDRVYALVDDTSGDYSKEAVSMWTDDNPHIPTITCKNTPHLSSIYGHINCYSMPFYTMRKTGTARRQMRQLIDLWQSADIWRIMRTANVTNYDICYKWLDSIRDLIDATIHAALVTIIDATANYGSSYLFDFKADNFAQAGTTLILLDVVYDTQARQRLT